MKTNALLALAFLALLSVASAAPNGHQVAEWLVRVKNVDPGEWIASVPYTDTTLVRWPFAFSPPVDADVLPPEQAAKWFDAWQDGAPVEHRGSVAYLNSVRAGAYIDVPVYGTNGTIIGSAAIICDGSPEPVAVWSAHSPRMNDAAIAASAIQAVRRRDTVRGDIGVSVSPAEYAAIKTVIAELEETKRAVRLIVSGLSNLKTNTTVWSNYTAGRTQITNALNAAQDLNAAAWRQSIKARLPE